MLALEGGRGCRPGSGLSQWPSLRLRGRHHWIGACLSFIQRAPLRASPQGATAGELIMRTETIEHPSATQGRRPTRIPTLVEQIRREYREMPGLMLSEAQARRLWDLDEGTCRTVLSSLTGCGFLKRTPRGTYVRAWT
jgi:hypothetical protein